MSRAGFLLVHTMVHTLDIHIDCNLMGACNKSTGNKHVLV